MTKNPYSYIEGYMEMCVSQLAEIAMKFGMLESAKLFGEYLVFRTRPAAYRLNKQNVKKRNFEIHMGHSILGRVALLQKGLELAKEHLRMMPALGDPDWRHDLLLSTDLLAFGEIDAVCTYLESCSRNLVKKLKSLEKRAPKPENLPALVSMKHEQYSSSTSLSDYMKNDLTRKIAKIEKWKISIRKGRVPKWGNSIWD